VKTEVAYCTIIARNYLPKALALAESLRRHMDGAVLDILVTDADEQSSMVEFEGVRYLTTADLEIPARQLLELAAMYDVVEFATAVKPLLLTKLLSTYAQVSYLDPDTYVVSPMTELSPAIAASANGLLLTPHFLDPSPPGQEHFSESHLLYVGVYNLGFCAVDRRALPFLQWWWGHLSTECVHDVLAGLFVDQKWVDIGSVLFGGSSFRHYGYNVSIANLHERAIQQDDMGYVVGAGPDRLRLFHFHAFDADKPEQLSARFSYEADADAAAVTSLSYEYSRAVVSKRSLTGAPPPYRFGTDTTGRRISRRIRGAYRAGVLSGAAGQLPSPFVSSEAPAYEAWRRGAWKLVTRQLVGDAIKSARCVLPEEYGVLKDKFPKAAKAVSARYVPKTGIWR
jgi:hypothetical protein